MYRGGAYQSSGSADSSSAPKDGGWYNRRIRLGGYIMSIPISFPDIEKEEAYFFIIENRNAFPNV